MKIGANIFTQIEIFYRKFVAEGPCIFWSECY